MRIPELEPLREAARGHRLRGPRQYTDAELLAAQAMLAEVRRAVDASAAALAGEIAHRSARDLGYGGLAQRSGARSPEALVQQVTGVSRREARELVTVGTLVSSDTAPSWITAVRDGSVSVGAASAITAGLGRADASVSQQTLDLAAERLASAATTLTVDELGVRARELRDELDAAGVPAREEELRSQRYLRLTALPDGMTRLAGMLDPESAARVKRVVDAATSPRRGGPRFTSPGDAARADALVADERTTEQIACDTVVDLLEAGSEVDPQGLLLGTAAPVQVIVAAQDFADGTGFARIEGESVAVSIATAKRIACAAGTEPLVLDADGQPLNLGRTRRLFSRAQRRAIAARDGGCLFCGRPPAWTEAHHIDEWSRGGRTDVADGVLLCRFHHLMVHNNGWRILRRGGRYLAIPPTAVDPLQREVPLGRRNPVVAHALHQSAREPALAGAAPPTSSGREG